jgi:CRP-like cAMP-binding protein
MSIVSDEAGQKWVDGNDVSLNGICIRYDIPKDEAVSFRPMMRIYTQDGILIREGDQDKTLFLLRSGSVGIYREVDGEQRRIAGVEAVNFVGEMSLLNDLPRSATVVVESDSALTYAIPRPNLMVILSNPKWSEILVTRLSRDLDQANAERVLANHQILELRTENARLGEELARHHEEMDRSKHQMQSLLGAVFLLQDAVRDIAVIGSRGWHTVEAASSVLRAMAKSHLPDLEISEQEADRKAVQAYLEAIQKREPSASKKAILAELLGKIRGKEE